MGMVLRTFFRIVGVVAFLMSLTVVACGLGAASPFQRSALTLFGLFMAALSALFVWLLRKPFFSRDCGDGRRS